jgi:hypothetical protein
LKLNCPLSVFNGVVLVIFNVVSTQFGDTEEFTDVLLSSLRAYQPVQSIMLDFMLLEKLVRVVGIQVIDSPSLVVHCSFTSIHNASKLFA